MIFIRLIDMFLFIFRLLFSFKNYLFLIFRKLKSKILILLWTNKAHLFNSLNLI